MASLWERQSRERPWKENGRLSNRLASELRRYRPASPQLYRNRREDKTRNEKQKEPLLDDSGKWLHLGPAVFNCTQAISQFLEGVIRPAIFLANAAMKPEIQAKERKEMVAHN